MAEEPVTTSQNVPPLKPGEVPRSNFVTVLAWLLIAGSGFVTCISLTQAVMLRQAGTRIHRSAPATRRLLRCRLGHLAHLGLVRRHGMHCVDIYHSRKVDRLCLLVNSSIEPVRHGRGDQIGCVLLHEMTRSGDRYQCEILIHPVPGSAKRARQ